MKVEWLSFDEGSDPILDLGPLLGLEQLVVREIVEFVEQIGASVTVRCEQSRKWRDTPRQRGDILDLCRGYAMERERGSPSM